MYECFHCLHRAVIWDSDFSFDDCGYEGDGIVQFLHCTNCGAEIEYRVPINLKENEDKEMDQQQVIAIGIMVMAIATFCFVWRKY